MAENDDAIREGQPPIPFDVLEELTQAEKQDAPNGSVPNIALPAQTKRRITTLTGGVATGAFVVLVGVLSLWTYHRGHKKNNEALRDQIDALKKQVEGLQKGEQPFHAPENVDLLKQAGILFKEKKFEEVIALCDKIHRTDKSFPDMWELKADAYKAIGWKNRVGPCYIVAKMWLDEQLHKLNEDHADIRQQALIPLYRAKLNRVEEKLAAWQNQ